MLAGLVITSVVFAHANLLRSDPADGSILEESPKEIRMWFDEPVSSRFSSVQLFDAQSKAIEVNGIQGDSSDPTLLIISMPELAPGVYSILWKVLSDTDGHFSQGLFVFGVGEGVDLGAASVAPVEDPPPSTPEVLFRWMNLLTLSGLIGGLAMIQSVIKPARWKADRYSARPIPIIPMVSRKVLKFSLWCAWGAVVVGVGLLIRQAFAILGDLPGGTSFLVAVKQTMFQTRWGNVWIVRQAVLLCTIVIIYYIDNKEREENPDLTGVGHKAAWFLVFGFSLALIIVQSLSSHAAGLTTGNNTLAVVSHGVHLFGAFLWIGGMLSLGAGLLPFIRNHREELGYLVKVGWRPFSNIAALSFGLLLATGLYNTGRQVASLDALLTTLYGQALLFKIALLLIVGYFGFFSTSLLHTSLSSSVKKLFENSTRWTPLEIDRLSRLIKIRVGLAALVLLVTGLITASAAPRDASFTIDYENVPGALSQTVDDFVVTLNTKPNRPGQNVFNVFAASTRRPVPVEIARVIMRFNYLDENIGRETVTLEEIEPGRFLLSGNYLKLPGNWQIDVVIRRQGMEDSVASFNWIVVPPGETRPEVVSKTPLTAPLTITAALTLLSIPLHMLIVFFVKGRNRMRKTAHERRIKSIKVKVSQ